MVHTNEAAIRGGGARPRRVPETQMCLCISGNSPGRETREGRPGMSDVSPLSGISGLSFDSTLLSALLFFCLVLFFSCLLVRSPDENKNTCLGAY